MSLGRGGASFGFSCLIKYYSNKYLWMSFTEQDTMSGFKATKHPLASQLGTSQWRRQRKDVLKHPGSCERHNWWVDHCQWSPSHPNRSRGVQSCPKRELAENRVTGPQTPLDAQPIQQGRIGQANRWVVWILKANVPSKCDSRSQKALYPLLKGYVCLLL